MTFYSLHTKIMLLYSVKQFRGDFSIEFVDEPLLTSLLTSFGLSNQITQCSNILSSLHSFASCVFQRIKTVCNYFTRRKEVSCIMFSPFHKVFQCLSESFLMYFQCIGVSKNVHYFPSDCQARSVGVESARERMFAGEKVNFTEVQRCSCRSIPKIYSQISSQCSS